jgi:hypothetical protein
MTVRNAASMGTYQADWIHRGFSGNGDMAPWLDRMAGRSALICGNGAGVWDDLSRACSLVPDPVFVAVNDSGMYMPKVDHWVSLHADAFPAWRAVRDMQERPPERPQFHSGTKRGFLDAWWDRLTPQFPLSGYFAMQLCWVMGADKIVLCGCPGDESPCWYGPRTRGAFDYGSKGIRDMVVREMNLRPDFKASVSSMSGWTQEFFGGL